MDIHRERETDMNSEKQRDIRINDFTECILENSTSKDRLGRLHIKDFYW